MNGKILKQLKALQPGCLLRVDWLDASEDTVPLTKHKKPEWLISEYGIFLGVEGSPKHILIGKFYSHRDKKWRATRIPTLLIVNTQILSQNLVDEKHLRRYIVETSKRAVEVNYGP